MAAERRGDRARQVVGAAMAAEQRHDRRAVLRHRDNRRLLALVGKERREHADQDAGGADADDRSAFGKQRAEVSRRIARDMHLAADGVGGEVRGRRARLRQRNEDRLHRMFRETRIMEK